MNIIALIPARGGSKGVPQKNIKNISSNPLISFSIISGLESKFINKVYVSSENRKIQEISEYANTQLFSLLINEAFVL